MLPSKAKTVFNVSHLAGNFCFLSRDVAKIRVSYVIYATELKTQHLIDKKNHSSFHMQTFSNLISLFWGI